jgi:trimethylamine:corrinoid methyltransferase-like protein
MPLNFIRMTRDGWQAKGGSELNARVTEFCKDILAKAEPVALPQNMTQELDSIVTRADTNLQ